MVDKIPQRDQNVSRQAQSPQEHGTSDRNKLCMLPRALYIPHDNLETISVVGIFFFFCLSPSSLVAVLGQNLYRPQQSLTTDHPSLAQLFFSLSLFLLSPPHIPSIQFILYTNLKSFCRGGELAVEEGRKSQGSCSRCVHFFLRAFTSPYTTPIVLTVLFLCYSTISCQYTPPNFFPTRYPPISTIRDPVFQIYI